jgi:histidine ammonia-lyase
VAHAQNLVLADGITLTCDALAAVARGGAPVAVAPEGLARAAAAHQAARGAVDASAFYGRTTGVGANHRVAVRPANGHGLRLLRSHAGGAGEPVATDVARGALAIRLNQLAAGGSGADPAWIEAVAAALSAGLTPQFPVLGAIGTGDLTGLATTALALIGERPWRSADGLVLRPLLSPAVADAEALAFLSSNAVTLAQATLAHHDLTALLDAELRIAALSHLALSGSAQPYAEPVQATPPVPAPACRTRTGCAPCPRFTAPRSTRWARSNGCWAPS